MKASNIVLAGHMEKWSIYFDSEFKCLCITPGIFDNRVLPMNKTNIKNIEVTERKTSTSSSSAYKKGLLGGLLFGNVGAIAGASSANQNEIYTIAVTWNSNKRSLIEIDGNYYKQLQHDLF